MKVKLYVPGYYDSRNDYYWCPGEIGVREIRRFMKTWIKDSTQDNQWFTGENQPYLEHEGFKLVITEDKKYAEASDLIEELLGMPFALEDDGRP